VADNPIHVMSRRVRDAAVSFGLAETRPMPFVATAPDESLRVRNPLAEDEPYLRTAVLTTLASRAEYNLSRMQGNVRLFEIGSVFVPSGERLPREEIRVGALLMGASRPPHFTEPSPPPFDAWDAKALALALARAAWPGEPVTLSSSESDAGASRSHDVLWTVSVGVTPRTVGTVTAVALDRPVWAEDAFGVEIVLDVMPSADVAGAGTNAHARPTSSGAGERSPSPWTGLGVTPLPTLTATSFALALLVPQELSAARVDAVLREASGDLLEALELFDEFRGKGVPDGFRSLAWRLTFRHPERTLKEKEIEGRRQRLLQTLDRELGVRPRAS
jgi:phenylalanyl-tRNA synthetase beta chain